MASRVPSFRPPVATRVGPAFAQRTRADRCAQGQAAYDAKRGNSAKRGYDRKWRAARLGFLADKPLCVLCEERGLYVPATLVDHIRPVAGGDDPLFFDTGNWQGLCRACHQKKTHDDRAAGLTRRGKGS